MNTPFEQAYDAYLLRKNAERQAQMLRLRHELASTRYSDTHGKPSGAVRRSSSSTSRPPQSAG